MARATGFCFFCKPVQNRNNPHSILPNKEGRHTVKIVDSSTSVARIFLLISIGLGFGEPWGIPPNSIQRENWVFTHFFFFYEESLSHDDDRKTPLLSDKRMFSSISGLGRVCGQHCVGRHTATRNQVTPILEIQNESLAAIESEFAGAECARPTATSFFAYKSS